MSMEFKSNGARMLWGFNGGSESSACDTTVPSFRKRGIDFFQAKKAQKTCINFLKDQTCSNMMNLICSKLKRLTNMNLIFPIFKKLKNHTLNSNSKKDREIGNIVVIDVNYSGVQGRFFFIPNFGFS